MRYSLITVLALVAAALAAPAPAPTPAPEALPVPSVPLCPLTVCIKRREAEAAAAGPIVTPGCQCS
jgi:hypothetical protein